MATTLWTLWSEAERISREAASLEAKVNETCPNDLRAKLELLMEEGDLAKDANRLTVKRAKLDCKTADYCREKQRLEENREKLCPVRG